ncbi:unnamed protein product [Cylicocyclus nassatus]|uniref:DNA-binding regulatory protein, YebC/PmpR family n=1 Tax=Cylicocyclus nassatus TaxID=53992 RepID=A0AA36GV17_CYLNA|nr:unnamed protein product [Cylicocyclus nassatus]
MLPSSSVFVRRALSVTSRLLKGHSKWQNIKATKGKNDMIKSQAMNNMLKKVKAAALRGGFDLKLNKELGALEQDFRSQGLSLDTFKNFLVKLKNKPEVECTFNVIGPAGSFFIVEAETDNVRAFENTMRKYFNKVGGFRFASEASAVQSWFQQKGVLTVKSELNGKPLQLEQMEEIGIELDCEDVALVEGEEKSFELLCQPERLSEVERTLVSKGYAVESAELQFRPMHPIRIEGDDAHKVEKLYELLQEDDSIRQIFDNIQPGE